MEKELRQIVGSWPRMLLLFVALTGIFSVFVFQEMFVLSRYFGCNINPTVDFCGKKVVRVFLNDIFMMTFIYAWFNDSRVNWMAWRLMMIDFLGLLPLYLILKLSLEGTSELSSPLLSQFHRIIVNPLIMVLLIPAIYLVRSSRQFDQGGH